MYTKGQTLKIHEKQMEEFRHFPVMKKKLPGLVWWRGG